MTDDCKCNNGQCGDCSCDPHPTNDAYIQCSICQQPTSRDTIQGFSVDAEQVGKRLIFKACPICQAKARTHTLIVCLGCKRLAWQRHHKDTPHGVHYRVITQCEACAVDGMMSGLRWIAGADAIH